MKKVALACIMVCTLIIIVLLGLNCTIFGKARQYKSFFTDQTITLWKDYVVFGEYDGLMAPKDNCIKFEHKKGANIEIFFKRDNTITIWSELNKPIETYFDNNKYDVKVYYGPENLRQYYDECQYSDSLAVMAYKFRKYPLGLEVKMYEIADDTIYISNYNIEFKSISKKQKCIFPRDYEGFNR